MGGRYIIPREEEVKVYVELVTAILEKVGYRSSKIWKRWVTRIKVPHTSRWYLNAGDKSDDILVKPW